MRVVVCGALFAALASIAAPADAAPFYHRTCDTEMACGLFQRIQDAPATPPPAPASPAPTSPAPTSPAAAPTTSAPPAIATHTTTIAVAKLLDGMKQAASIAILHSKTAMANGKVSKSSLLFVNAADAYRSKIIALSSAIATKDGAQISKATREASIAYAKLVATSRLLGLEDKTLTEVVRSITSSWASYASYFVLAQAKALPANAVNIQGAGQTIDKLYEQLTLVESRTATNKRVGRQVAYMKRRIDRHKKNGITIATYRYAMSDLVLVRGSYLALLDVSNVYFTDLVSTLNAVEASFADTEAYWNAYYQGVYDTAVLQALSGNITVPDDTALNTAAIDKSEVDDAANDQTVAKAVKDINDGPNDDAAAILTPDDGNDPLDDPLASETQFDCVAEGCGDTQAVNPTADTSQVDVAPPADAGSAQPSDNSAPPSAAASSPQDNGTSGKDATTAPSDNAPAASPPSADQNAVPPADMTPAPSDATTPSPPNAAQPAPPQPEATPSEAAPAPLDNGPPADNSATPPPSDSPPADTSPPPADTPAQPDAPPTDSGGANDHGAN